MSTQPRCGDCRHWATPKEAERTGQHSMEHDDLPLGRCEAITHHESYEPVTTLAVTVDGSGYYSALRTQEDFGCVLFAAKDTEASTGETT